MSLIAKLIISLVITAIAAVLTTILLQGETVAMFDLRITVAFLAATLATAIIVGNSRAPSSTTSESTHEEYTSLDGDRESGTVKWFNVSKGFGFIIKEDGEELFVHFRSIRGEGRRSLRDGQKVSFIVTESEKGPQAEDVVGED